VEALVREIQECEAKILRTEFTRTNYVDNLKYKYMSISHWLKNHNKYGMREIIKNQISLKCDYKKTYSISIIALVNEYWGNKVKSITCMHKNVRINIKYFCGMSCAKLN